MNSETRKAWLPVSMKSNTRTQLGWSSSAMIRASSRKASRKAGSATIAWPSCLIATGLWRSSCQPRYTVP